jgi:tetratricopeptide (TPR) repeat protein
VLLAVLLGSVLAACATPAPPAPEPRVPPREQPFLRDPMAGYPLTADPELASEVRSAHRDLLSVAEPESVAAVADALLEEAPGFHPAEVLRAQADFLLRRESEVVRRLSPVVDELPDYLAAQQLLGRAAERLGEVVTAYRAFRRVAPASELARRRAAELEPRAVEIVVNRFDDQLGRGQIEAAEHELETLVGWLGEDDLLVLDARWRLVAAGGDLEGELEVVRRLVDLELEPELGLERRLAELELEVGDVRAGLEQLESLADRHPDDPTLGDLLERAKFLWRLQLLPEKVQSLRRAPRLDRAQLATLFYWLVPQVRYGEVSNPPIATDILDHPQRDEIVRVMNLGLMRPDETVHRFEPEATATRATTFAALLRLLGLAERRPECLEGVDPRELPSAPSVVCARAARCRLIPEVADCLPAAPISGAEAFEYFRYGLDLLGSR